MVAIETFPFIFSLTSPFKPRPILKLSIVLCRIISKLRVTIVVLLDKREEIFHAYKSRDKEGFKGITRIFTNRRK